MLKYSGALDYSIFFFLSCWPKLCLYVSSFHFQSLPISSLEISSFQLTQIEFFSRVGIFHHTKTSNFSAGPTAVCLTSAFIELVISIVSWLLILFVFYCKCLLCLCSHCCTTLATALSLRGYLLMACSTALAAVSCFAVFSVSCWYRSF